MAQTNGLGSYASGTVSQLLTRRYHGLLVAALAPPLDRTVLLSKLDETAVVDGTEYPMSTNRWNESAGELTPVGFDNIAGLQLDGSMPVWRFALGDVTLEKRVWMERHEDTTYVGYQHLSGGDPIQLSIKVLVNYRDFHSNTRSGDWRMNIGTVDSGIRVEAFSGAVPFVVKCAGASVTPDHTWYLNHYLDGEAYRGLDPLGDDLYAARFDVLLQPGESATVVASTNLEAETDGDVALAREQSYAAALVSGYSDAPEWIRQLVLAADQFIVQRPVDDGSTGATIIAGYGTAWMAFYTLEMLAIAMELSKTDPVYQDMATKFLEHFLSIARAMTAAGKCLWDDEDGFFYDVSRLPDGTSFPLKLRSMVGLIPLLAVTVIDRERVDDVPEFADRMHWFLQNRPHLSENIVSLDDRTAGHRHLVSILDDERLSSVLEYMLAENEFLSRNGVRSLSKAYDGRPYRIEIDGQPFGIAYEPAESASGVFGGNSNWRGPVWFPINYLLIEALGRFHEYYGDDFGIEYPRGSGNLHSLDSIAKDLFPATHRSVCSRR